MIDWGAPIWIYLWLAGMAGGAYFAAFVIDRFVNDKPLLRLATYLGVPLAIIGVLLLVVDLGNQQLFWHLFSRFKVQSPMSMGTWILLLWIIMAIVMIFSWWLENRVSRQVAESLSRLRGFISWINVVLAAALIAYTGVLLAVSNEALWSNTPLLPALFAASAVSTGVALLILAATGFKSLGVSSNTVELLSKADIRAIVVEIAILVGYIIWLATSSDGSEALRILVAGPMAAAFWVGVVLLALLIPSGLHFTARGKALESKGLWLTTLTSSISVIVGGLILRAVITIGGQL